MGERKKVGSSSYYQVIHTLLLYTDIVCAYHG